MKFETEDEVLTIELDQDPETPRAWDNLGKMVLSHRRYDFPNEIDLNFDSYSSWNEIEEALYEEYNAEIVLPVFLYDHSILRIKVGSFNGLLPQGHAEFDSGQIGFIFVSKEAIKEEGITKERAKNILLGEVDTFDHYVSGTIYYYSLDKKVKCDACGHTELENIDSCGGFYDLDSIFGDLDPKWKKKYEEGDYNEN